jgi:predicted transcriptional regulator
VDNAATTSGQLGCGSDRRLANLRRYDRFCSQSLAFTNRQLRYLANCGTSLRVAQWSCERMAGKGVRMKQIHKGPMSAAIDSETSPAKEAAHGQRILEATAGIIAAFVGNNRVESAALPGLISDVQTSLRKIIAPMHDDHDPLVPAVPIKDSIRPDYLICLEDGKRVKMLKPYLLRHFGMTPDDYRNRWGLPQSYPMTPPNLSAQRSQLSKILRDQQLERARQKASGAKPPLPGISAETQPRRLRMVGRTSATTKTVSGTDPQNNASCKP